MNRDDKDITQQTRNENKVVNCRRFEIHEGYATAFPPRGELLGHVPAEAARMLSQLIILSSFNSSRNASIIIDADAGIQTSGEVSIDALLRADSIRNLLRSNVRDISRESKLGILSKTAKWRLVTAVRLRDKRNRSASSRLLKSLQSRPASVVRLAGRLRFFNLANRFAQTIRSRIERAKIDDVRHQARMKDREPKRNGVRRNETHAQDKIANEKIEP